MPRTMDHEARERQVIEAAWRVIVREGITGLTVRNVAAEAGLAPSSLRYAFPTQAGVRERAIRALLEHLRARLDVVPASAHWARNTLLELVPLDAQRRIEMQVSLALGVAAVTDVDLQPLRIELADAVRQVCRDVCHELGVDDGRRIAELHALVDGLALHVVLDGDDDGAWVVPLLDGHIARLADESRSGS
jgi:AcrR family transcriptional regulator